MASLTTKVLNSLGWVFTNMAAKNVLQFARTVILWRILSEDDFGLNGIAWLAINAFTLLQDMGFQNALIQRKTDLDKAVSVTWYVNVLIRVVVYAILFLVAPFVAQHFEEPEVCPIIRVASICIVIGSFGSANDALLRKEFQFRKILVVDSVELVVLIAVQVILALLGFGVWSLVYGTIVSAAVRSLVLWRIAPIRLVAFDLVVAREMFHFGKHMTFSTLLIWLIGNMDYYFIGKYLGKAALGFYTLAFRLAFLVATNVARMLGAVLFPAFSEIGHDRARVCGAWLRSVRYSMTLMMPMALGMIMFSREILLTFYKPKCEVVVASMAILTLAALCRGVGVPLGDMQKGIGRPDLLTRVAFWHALAMAPLLFLATAAFQWGVGAFVARTALEPVERSLALVLTGPLTMQIGLTGASLAVSGSTLAIGLGLGLLLTARHVSFTAREVLDALRPSLLAGVAMAVAGWGGKFLFAMAFPGIPPFVTLLLFGSASCVAYLMALWMLFPAMVADIRGLLDRRRAENRSALRKAEAASSGRA